MRVFIHHSDQNTIIINKLSFTDIFFSYNGKKKKITTTFWESKQTVPFLSKLKLNVNLSAR